MALSVAGGVVVVVVVVVVFPVLFLDLTAVTHVCDLRQRSRCGLSAPPHTHTHTHKSALKQRNTFVNGIFRSWFLRVEA